MTICKAMGHVKTDLILRPNATYVCRHCGKVLANNERDALPAKR